MSFTERFPKKDLKIISVPFSGGQGKGGVDDGPQQLLDHGLIKEVEQLGWIPEFTGHLDLPAPASDEPIGHIKNPRYVSNTAQTVYEEVSKAAKKGAFPLTIGGDHSIGTGTIAGVQSAHPDACVIWVDAHADINTPAATASGNLHGCPVSFVLGIDEPLSDKPGEDIFDWVPHCLDDSRLAYIALRDLDPFERQYLREHNIAAYTMRHVDQFGIGQVVEMALERVNPGNKRPIHLSFDIDAIDPFFAPATGTTVRGGLTWREGSYICERLAETGNLVAMDLVEVNPSLGEHPEAAPQTATVAISLIKSALGDVLL
jgi:arginase